MEHLISGWLRIKSDRIPIHVGSLFKQYTKEKKTNK